MSWIDDATVARLEARFGRPREIALTDALSPDHFALLLRKGRGGLRRAHDVTLLIADGRGRFAVTRKPQYPPGVFRPPSGDIDPGEEFEAGARREAREETGLEIQLVRYVLRCRATFHCAAAGGEAGAESAAAGRAAQGSAAGEAAAGGAAPGPAAPVPWTTHVFLARAIGVPPSGALVPLDRREIAEARWADREELRGSLLAGLRATGAGGLLYRAALQEAVLDEIERLERAGAIRILGA